ncbi:MAG: hypothetical protein ACOVT5_00520, partial [Armatimonadaceae bacterium]
DKVALEVLNLKPTHGTADYAAALTLVADTLARSPRNYPRRQVTIFTDLQRSAWSPTLPKTDAPPPDYWPRILPRADVAVVNVAAEDADNMTIANVTLADPLPLVDQPTAVLVQVQNFGKSNRQSVRVELSLLRPGAADNASPVPVGSQALDVVESGKQASLAFVLDGPNRFRDAGPHLLQVRLTDADG